MNRGDLVDRANILSLEVIPEARRLTEVEVDAGLNNLSSIKIADKPRMADFALWAEACTRAYWRAGTFIKAYREAEPKLK